VGQHRKEQVGQHRKEQVGQHRRNLHISAIEKQTGLEVLIILHYIDDHYMNEEKAEIQKTMKILNSHPSSFTYVQDVPFPLVRAK
jgi:hypothetical protein